MSRKLSTWRDVDPYGATPQDELGPGRPPPAPVDVDHTDEDLIVWLFELSRYDRKMYLQVRDVGVKLIEEYKKRLVIPD